MKQSFAQLQEIIGHKFSSTGLLADALCHKSYINESKQNNNSYERLEFLGDSVLGVIVSRFIYDNYPHLPEGELTKLRASVVCEATLAHAARKLELGRFVMLSHGEAKTGGADRDAILCDVFESVVAAVYLDSDMDTVRDFVLRCLSDVIDSHASNMSFVSDYKTALQEIVQQSGGRVEYRLINETGPDHCKEYSFAVYVNGTYVARGTGTSKKKSQQEAAKAAVDKL